MSNIALLSPSLVYRPTSSSTTTQIPGVRVELELTATPDNTTKKSTIKWNLYLRNTSTSLSFSFLAVPWHMEFPVQ